MLDYDLLIVGILASIEFKEEKIYDGKTVPARNILNFVRFLSDGSMQPLKVKYLGSIPDTVKSGDKVRVSVTVSSMDRIIYFSGSDIKKV